VELRVYRGEIVGRLVGSLVLVSDFCGDNGKRK
jgi:hypothetical protein